jgi:hypothetical protein
MTPRPDTETIIAEAVSVLPRIAAALDPKQQPAGGSWVALTVHSPRDEASGESVVLHRAWFTWRYDTPLEPLEESRYLELTREATTGNIKVPVWTFELTPLGDDEWEVGYWFAAPLRMWLGDPAGGRTMGYGFSYVARPGGDGWVLEDGDILAG